MPIQKGPANLGTGVIQTAELATDLVVTHALGSASTPSITFTGDTNTGIFSPTADTIAFTEGGTEVMRINSSGNLLVNTSTARTAFFNASNTPLLQIEGTTFNTASQSIVRNSADAAGSFLILGKTRGTSVGGTSLLSSGDVIGVLSFQGSDGTDLVEGARIFAVVDTTAGANDMPAALVFNTTADGAASSTERMRIDSTALSLTGLQGIKFPSTQVASSDANTLDDYEEGTWTPSLGGNTTYTTQVGAYTKIGRLVVATFEVNVSSIGTGSSTTISGLPFTSFSSPTNGMAGMVGYFTGGANSVVMITLRIDLGSTTIGVASIASSATGMNAGLAFFQNSTRILGTITYMTA